MRGGASVYCCTRAARAAARVGQANERRRTTITHLLLLIRRCERCKSVCTARKPPRLDRPSSWYDWCSRASCRKAPIMRPPHTSLLTQRLIRCMKICVVYQNYQNIAHGVFVYSAVLIGPLLAVIHQGIARWYAEIKEVMLFYMHVQHTIAPNNCLSN